MPAVSPTQHRASVAAPAPRHVASSRNSPLAEAEWSSRLRRFPGIPPMLWPDLVFGFALRPSAPGNDQSDIVLLFAGAELLDPIENRGEQGLRRQFTMPLHRFNQPLLSEFLALIAE